MTSRGRLRRTIRRHVWKILVFMGAACASIAILLPTYLVPKLSVLPSRVSQSVTAYATDAEILDDGSIARGVLVSEKHVPLQIQVHVESQMPTTDRAVTLVAAVRTLRADRSGDAAVVSAYLDQVTLNRQTARPLSQPPPLTTHSSSRAADQTPRTGYQYTFPFKAQRIAYPVYDSEARMSRPAQYVDDSRVLKGIRLYHYRQVIDRQNLYRSIGEIASISLPGRAIGLPLTAGVVRLDLIYSVTRDLWVAPDTGQIVDQRQQVTRELVYGTKRFTTLRADIRFTPEAIEANVEGARTYTRLVWWGSRGAPTIMGILAAVLLGAGLTAARSAYKETDISGTAG